jgi:glycosyltransferase involved in cell wall biosynthesis
MPSPSNLNTIFKNISFTRQKQADINHITGDVHYAVLGCSKKNINVLTIHDCVTLYRYAKTNPRYWLIKWIWYDLPIKKADMVTVISENTRRDLLRFTNCNPQKLRVIGNFVDPGFQQSSYHFKEEKTHILFIGTTENKNLDRLIEALDGLDVLLDIVGILSESQIVRLKSHRIEYTQSIGLTKEALQAKYRDCDLLAFPSTYEGFGLPIIEAQASGRPILTSKLSPMQEVAGDGACLVDPYDSLSIRKGLQQIIQNHSYRENIIKAGLENVKRFSLAHVTTQYVDLYRELLEKKKMVKNS